MGVLFIDSFDHYTTLSQKGWTSNASISAGNGRFSTNGLYIADDENYAQRSLGAQRQTVYIGGAIKVTLNSGTVGIGLWQILDAGTPQCGLIITPSGIIQAIRGYAYTGYYTVLGSSSGSVLPMNEWHHLEVKYKVDNSAGEIVVNVDGTQVINVTGADTQVSANAYADLFYMNWWGSHPYSFYIDDLYIADDGFKGDCRVQCILPSGVGSYNQWTPNTGSNNYANVDESVPDTNDYNYSATAGNIDAFLTGDLTPTAGTVYAVAGNFYCRKNDAGSRQIAIVTKIDGTDQINSGTAMPSSFGFIQDIQETQPGGSSWSISSVNYAQMGYKQIA